MYEATSLHFNRWNARHNLAECSVYLCCKYFSVNFPIQFFAKTYNFVCIIKKFQSSKFIMPQTWHQLCNSDFIYICKLENCIDFWHPEPLLHSVSMRKLDHKLKLQKEIGSCGNVVLPKNDANVVGEKNLKWTNTRNGRHGKKLSDDHQKKTAKVCWTCGEKRRARKVGARRKDQREKTKRKKEIGLHGGIGCWLQCSDCFAADRWPGQFQKHGSQRQTLTRYPKKKKKHAICIITNHYGMCITQQCKVTGDIDLGKDDCLFFCGFFSWHKI